MEAVTTLPRSRPLTVADLETVPDDGHRYELVNGALVVTPGPSDSHQAVVVHLIVALSATCPAELRVRTAPYDVVLADDTLVQPDVLVCRKSDISRRGLHAAPLLVVEVLSPSTALIDLNLKRARFEAAGVGAYWVVDPDVPRLIAWELRDGAYVEVADVCGDEQWTASLPFAVTLRPSDLPD